MSENKNAKKRTPCPQPVKETLWRIYFADDMIGKCYVCGKRIHFTDFEVGHNIAHNEGGRWDIDNLRPLCRSCNRSMGTETIEKFKEKFFRSIEYEKRSEQKNIPHGPLFGAKFFDNAGKHAKFSGHAAENAEFHDNSVELSEFDDTSANNAKFFDKSGKKSRFGKKR